MKYLKTLIMISANKNGVQKVFSEHAWNLLGKSKGGWKQNSSSVVENSIKAIPETGEKQKPTVQTTQNIVIEPIVEPVIVTDTEKNPIVTTEPIVTTVVDDIKTKSPFYSLAEDQLTKNLIKDYFDNNEIKYKTSDSLPDLINALEEFLVSDIEKLKLHFNL